MHHIVNNIMKTNDPLISVIVPIYNVEPYVRQCLDSLQNQTMKQIEIICVDDGSADRSGEIAEEYNRKDERFFVVHTENRGLSAARNRGIDEARAEWLMFVDSDDWVDRDFCRVPYQVAVRENADLVLFGHYRTNEKGKVKWEKRKEVKIGIVEAEEVILNAGVWNKLYRKELFAENRYPEGRVYEDFATTHKLINGAQVIYQCADNLYYYRNRSDSISNSISNRRDAYSARRDRYFELLSMGYPIKMDNDLLMTALNYCGQAEDINDPLYQDAVDIVKEIRGIPVGFSNKSILKLLMWKSNKAFYRSIYKILGKSMNSLRR